MMDLTIEQFDALVAEYDKVVAEVRNSIEVISCIPDSKDYLMALELLQPRVRYRDILARAIEQHEQQNFGMSD